MNSEEIASEIMQRSWKFGVAVLMQPNKVVRGDDGFASGGYFDSDARVLAVATDRPTEVWLGVLLHEYCHLTQWVEDQPSWRAYGNEMWDWLAGKRVRNPAELVRSVQAVEEDCERRTIRMIQELDAPLDLERYTRAANAYIHFHNVILETRKWYRQDVVLDQHAEVLAAANPTLDASFRKTPALLRKALLTIV